MTVNIQAQFAKKERELNGLEAIAKELVEDGLERRYAIVQFDSPRSTKDNREGTYTPTVKFLHIEPAIGEDDTKVVKDMLLKLFRQRVNKPDAPPPVGDTLFDDGAGEG